MQLSNYQEISESQLLNKQVLDHQGYLLGEVVAVNDQMDHSFRLVVRKASANLGADELIIESHHITSIDSKQAIHTDLNAATVVYSQGKTIPLVQEKLIVNRQRRKLGEVVVRKVTETEWVQIPIYKEKLLVHKEGEAQPIAEVSLGESQLPPGVAIAQPQSQASLGSNNRHSSSEPFVVGQWQSIDTALEVLDHLATGNGTANVPVNVFLFLKRDSSPGQIKLDFPTPNLATHFLRNLDSRWWQQCEYIRLETP